MSRLDEGLIRLNADLSALRLRWALIGGLAVSFRSAARTTKDLDVVIAVASDNELDTVVRSFHFRGYHDHPENPVASANGSVVAAEWDLTGVRLLATEDQKRTVLPVLLAGEESESFPPLLRGRVYGDFRMDDAYFTQAFDLILDVYGIPHRDTAVADLRESLRGQEMR